MTNKGHGGIGTVTHGHSEDAVNYLLCKCRFICTDALGECKAED